MANCSHQQCCICLKRECQQSMFQPRFKKFGGYFICGESCVVTAIAVAYNAACRLGGTTDRPCGKELKDSAAVLSDST